MYYFVIIFLKPYWVHMITILLVKTERIRKIKYISQGKMR